MIVLWIILGLLLIPVFTYWALLIAFCLWLIAEVATRIARRQGAAPAGGVEGACVESDAHDPRGSENGLAGKAVGLTAGAACSWHRPKVRR